MEENIIYVTKPNFIPDGDGHDHHPHGGGTPFVPPVIYTTPTVSVPPLNMNYVILGVAIIASLMIGYVVAKK